jgi:hypothetical protein
MDYLTKTVPVSEFFKDLVLPLSIYGLGSMDSILNMKYWEIREAANCLKDEGLQELFRATRGLEIPK